MMRKVSEMMRGPYRFNRAISNTSYATLGWRNVTVNYGLPFQPQISEIHNLNISTMRKWVRTSYTGMCFHLTVTLPPYYFSPGDLGVWELILYQTKGRIVKTRTICIRSSCITNFIYIVPRITVWTFDGSLKYNEDITIWNITSLTSLHFTFIHINCRLHVKKALHRR